MHVYIYEEPRTSSAALSPPCPALFQILALSGWIHSNTTARCFPRNQKISPAVSGASWTLKFKGQNRVPSQPCFLAPFVPSVPVLWPDRKPSGVQPRCFAGCQPFSGKDVRCRQNILRTVSRVTCVVLIASRKLKCSAMMIRYRQQMVAIRCTYMSGGGIEALGADTTIRFV